MTIKIAAIELRRGPNNSVATKSGKNRAFGGVTVAIKKKIKSKCKTVQLEKSILGILLATNSTKKL